MYNFNENHQIEVLNWLCVAVHISEGGMYVNCRLYGCSSTPCYQCFNGERSCFSACWYYFTAVVQTGCEHGGWYFHSWPSFSVGCSAALQVQEFCPTERLIQRIPNDLLILARKAGGIEPWGTLVHLGAHVLKQLSLVGWEQDDHVQILYCLRFWFMNLLVFGGCEILLPGRIGTTDTSGRLFG